MKRIIIILTLMLFIGMPLKTIAQDALGNSKQIDIIEGIAQNTDPQDNNKKRNTMAQEEVWLESLLTDTPQEGRELAIKMARKTIAAIQTDPEVRKRLRKDYAEDTVQLINIANIVALEYQTIAEANNYWR